MGAGEAIHLYLDRDGAGDDYVFGSSAFVTFENAGTGNTTLDDLLANQWLVVT